MWKSQLLQRKWHFKDIISANKIEQLNGVLPHPVPIVDNRLPLLYHFMYLNPASTQAELNSDGYDSYQAPPTFTRRLWVGGSIEQVHPLSIGDSVSLTETVAKVRELRGGSPLVEITREFKSDACDRVLLVETRRLMYLQSLYDKDGSGPRRKKSPHTALYSHTVHLSPTDLVRYSALTYNAHKIHYDREYLTGVEKYPSLLVHGPLLLTMMVTYLVQKLPHLVVAKVQYKNIQPLFVRDELVLNLAPSADGAVAVWITNGDLELCCECVLFPAAT